MDILRHGRTGSATPNIKINQGDEIDENMLVDDDYRHMANNPHAELQAMRDIINNPYSSQQAKQIARKALEHGQKYLNSRK